LEISTTSLDIFFNKVRAGCAERTPKHTCSGTLRAGSEHRVSLITLYLPGNPNDPPLRLRDALHRRSYMMLRHTENAWKRVGHDADQTHTEPKLERKGRQPKKITQELGST
ncbi:unnamed protein product, partial [Ectocarpus sp. 4 AP-2014]